MEFLVIRGNSLRQAQSDVILSSSKDDPRRRLKVGDSVPLRQAQSDSQYVILSSSKDDTKSKDDPPRGLRVFDPVPLRQAQSDRKSKDDTKSKDDPQRRSKSRN